jgi:hypothetical protein
MVNRIEMVVLDPGNKRGHVFEAWIRLVQYELGCLFRQQTVLDLGWIYSKLKKALIRELLYPIIDCRSVQSF